MSITCRSQHLREGLTDKGVLEDVDVAAGDAIDLATCRASRRGGRLVTSASGLACCCAAGKTSAGNSQTIGLAQVVGTVQLSESGTQRPCA